MMGRRRWRLSNENYFDADHLNTIRAAFKDDDVYAVLTKLLDRLESVIEQARAKQCDQFKSRLSLRVFSVTLEFRNFDGAQYKASVALSRAYEQGSGRRLCMNGAMPLAGAIHSLVMTKGKFVPVRRISRRRRE
jgi:hypothetical protein